MRLLEAVGGHRQLTGRAKGAHKEVMVIGTLNRCAEIIKNTYVSSKDRHAASMGRLERAFWSIWGLGEPSLSCDMRRHPSRAVRHCITLGRRGA